MTEPTPEVATPELTASEVAPRDVVSPPKPPAGGFAVGLLAAIAAAVVGAIIWAVITVTTDYRIGVVAVGIGVLVGLAIDRFGGGDRRLPAAGAVITLIGCALGELFADAHIYGQPYGRGTFGELGRPHELWSIYTHRFAAFNAVFYAIGAYEAFQFGRRGVRRFQAATAAAPPAPPPATPDDSAIAQ